MVLARLGNPRRVLARAPRGGVDCGALIGWAGGEPWDGAVASSGIWAATLQWDGLPTLETLHPVVGHAQVTVMLSIDRCAPGSKGDTLLLLLRRSNLSCPESIKRSVVLRSSQQREKLNQAVA